MKTKRVLILGATSNIAEATARLYAAEGASLILAGRRSERLNEIARDLQVRGAAKVESTVLDFVETNPNSALSDMTKSLGGVDHILLAYGYMGNHAKAERDLGEACQIIDVNFGSAAKWALSAAEIIEKQGAGSLIILGSVAGERGRRANYIYGAAKAGIATLAQGIAHRFAGNGPRIVVVKIGPTDTAMTADMRKKGPLWAKPEQVATIVRRAADRNSTIVYAPARWRLIMFIIRLIPSAIFNKMNI